MKNRKPAASRSPDMSQEPAENAEPSLGGDIRGRIGRQLREMYDDVVAQGVPDRFVELLTRLEKQNENEK
jgi:Anti-sigma factor NepR